MGGTRRKLLYVRGGRLLDALTLETVRVWEPVCEEIHAAEYRVVLESRDGHQTILEEDERGVWIKEGGDCIALTTGNRVYLPGFNGHPYAAWLRALHAEILVNILPVGPVPNLWVYPRPWYRDASMMLMCLEKTKNLMLVEPWIMGLHKVFDRNNAGDAEPDNLGQVLYMVSLIQADKHPIIDNVLRAVPDYCRNRHLVGMTDGGEKPVYQTKWLKFGLKSLRLDDPFRIPSVFDPYSALFWMDYRNEHIAGKRFSGNTLQLYPYLNWAEAHFHEDEPPEVLGTIDSPLTREGSASEAEYWRQKQLADCGAISERQVREHMAMPHTWHAAEMFLYLLELDGRPAGT